jgi:transposase
LPAILSFHSHLKVFVATAPCDLRMSFNGLWAAAQERLGEDPRSGALFVFGNRRRNRIKILYFDGTGVCVLAKRLEEGTFAWPQSAGEPQAKLRLAPQALQLLLDGVELKAGENGSVLDIDILVRREAALGKWHANSESNIRGRSIT